MSWTGCPDPSLVATVAATPQGGSAAPTVGTGGAIIVLAAAAVRDADRHRTRWSGRAAGHVDTVHLGSDGGRLTVVPDVFWRVRAVHASRSQRAVGQPTAVGAQVDCVDVPSGTPGPGGPGVPLGTST